VGAVAGDVDLTPAPQLLQHRLERRVQQTRVDAVSEDEINFGSEISEAKKSE
jgi:hypothetical protein